VAGIMGGGPAGALAQTPAATGHVLHPEEGHDVVAPEPSEFSSQEPDAFDRPDAGDHEPSDQDQ
jgi:hypothetical protein